MEVLHPDFSRCATERSIQIEWSNRLFKLAAQEGRPDAPSLIEVDVPFGVCGSTIDDPNEVEIPSEKQPCILRSLYPTEISTLESMCGCKCRDWSAIRILQRSQEVNDLSLCLPTLISDTRLDGTVVLIHVSLVKSFNEEIKETITLMERMIPIGIHGCNVISNSMIHINTAKVHQCNIISHTYIDSYSTVMNCSYITMSNIDDVADTITENPAVDVLSVSVGAESGGGRVLQLHPESTMMHIGQQIGGSSSRTAPNEDDSEQIIHSAHFNMIGSYCIVRDTPTVRGVYLHSKSSIIAATSVEQVLLFPGSKISNACTVRNAILQWDCTITDHSYVLDVFFMEQAMAGPQSTVTNSVLGPDVHISCGEVHASVLGPNTNAHHQSLVIATLWLCGRGNVGYGSNVGSNHTGRIPDQECCAGEGIFWGLSCVIKFPVDLTFSPYSIVAAGTTMVPQRCTMPFSLIMNTTTTTGRMNRSGTEIVPGWVLLHSPYTVVRSEQKFAQRRKAKRHMNYTGWKIIRPDIVNQCYVARQHLLGVTTAKGNADDVIYSERDIPGVGANQMTEKGRLIGIQAYSELIQQFALQGLYTFLVEACKTCTDASLLHILTKEFRSSDVSTASVVDESKAVGWPMFPWDDCGTSLLWQSQRVTLLREYPKSKDENIGEWTMNLLGKFITIEKKFSERVRQCKQRDDSRGAATIPGYEESHVLVDQDAVVISVEYEIEQRKQDVKKLLQKISEYL